MEEIYKDYALPVYKYLLTLTRDPEFAEELTAETFYRAMKKHKEFRGESKVFDKVGSFNDFYNNFNDWTNLFSK